MEFRLTYRGPLTASRRGVAAEKHALRLHFDPQLRELWERLPLKRFVEGRDKSALRGLLPSKGELHPDAAAHEIGGRTFVPLVCGAAYLFAELSILLLRPGAPGDITTHGGDLDNRLKNLIDGLRSPQNAPEIPENAKFPSDGRLYTVLEDDKLITKLSVETDRLLGSAPNGEVEAVIHVRVRPIVGTLGNLHVVG